MERKGDFVILHLNPDIFSTINEIMRDAYDLKNGKPVNKSAIEKSELQKVAQGNSDISFLPNFDGECK